MKLHGYFRSSAAYRVRIALSLKGIACEHAPVNLAEGEHLGVAWAAVNPFRSVPVLEDGGALLTQSLAIIEYLDETHPEPPLLPPDPLGRARVRALAMAVGCDIHPLNNLRVLTYLSGDLGAGKAQRSAWYHHWICRGFEGIEAELSSSPHAGTFCHGDTATLADCCLVPQVFNARRFAVDLEPYPAIRRIEAACLALAAFDAARPERQEDAVGGA